MRISTLGGVEESPLKLLREVDTTDKIRKYRVDYSNNPPIGVSFISPISGTSGRLHSEFIRLLFLQVHRETDRFFSVSGVHQGYSFMCQSIY